MWLKADPHRRASVSADVAGMTSSGLFQRIFAGNDGESFLHAESGVPNHRNSARAKTAVRAKSNQDLVIIGRHCRTTGQVWQFWPSAGYVRSLLRFLTKIRYYSCSVFERIRMRRCPQCRKETSWQDNPWRPFCSERCQMIDLGRWASEDYRIPLNEYADDVKSDFDNESTINDEK
jgi:endogenous inhibitor of DNA gyrase (YacG/DUF329 family)